MTTRSLFFLLKRSYHNNHRSPALFYVKDQTPLRWFSSGALKVDSAKESSALTSSADDLKSRIFRLRFSKRSATNALQRWVNEGNKVSLQELRQIAKELNRARRYKHALEILMWMEARQANCKISAADHAMRLELILKVHDLHKAEEYFTNIPDISSLKAACLPLLNHYVKARNIGEAESFMSKLQALGLTATPHPFNEMMKLYIATGHLKKVPLFIKEMKRNSIPRNVLSYNLWMSAAHALSGVPYAEIIYKEMMFDKNVKVGWSTYCTLANFYIKSGLSGKALDSLKAAEGKLSTKNRLGYFFLITLYTALGNKNGVLRLWEASKKVPGRITCEHYKCVLSCLVKLGEIKEAERVFMTWESKLRNYDVRVSNVLLSAYMRMGFMEKAEMLHDQTVEKGASPNHKTWEILMEGWVKKKEMPKAIEAMKNGCLLLEECNWRPPHTTLLAILQYFEEMNNIDDAMEYVEVLYKFKLTSLPIYHSLLRLHVRAQRPPARVLEMMEKDTGEIIGGRTVS